MRLIEGVADPSFDPSLSASRFDPPSPLAGALILEPEFDMALPAYNANINGLYAWRFDPEVFRMLWSFVPEVLCFPMLRRSPREKVLKAIFGANLGALGCAPVRPRAENNWTSLSLPWPAGLSKVVGFGCSKFDVYPTY